MGMAAPEEVVAVALAKKTVKTKKKKKAKKKKKRKKAKKKKKTRKEGGRKSAKSKAAGRKKALAMKAKGLGIFAPKTLSKELAGICGGNKMARTQVVKKVWAYIKSRKLNKGRTINPDATLKAVVPSSCSMFKLMGHLNKHIK